MPFVSGFLRVRRRGHPDIGLPDPEHPVDPDYGIEEHPPGVGGGPILPDVDPPDPPPGIWPPLTPDNPWRPVDPGWGLRPGLPEHPGQPLPPTRPPAQPGQPLPPGVGGGPIVPPEGEVKPPIALPPGVIWPPLPPGVHGKYLALVVVFVIRGGPKYRYVVVDADLRPEHPIAPGEGAQPK